MTSSNKILILQIKNIELKDLFIQNQAADIDYDNNLLILQSKQTYGTPGILYKDKFKLKSNTEYIFEVIGNSNREKSFFITLINMKGKYLQHNNIFLKTNKLLSKNKTFYYNKHKPLNIKFGILDYKPKLTNYCMIKEFNIYEKKKIHKNTKPYTPHYSNYHPPIEPSLHPQTFNYYPKSYHKNNYYSDDTYHNSYITNCKNQISQKYCYSNPCYKKNIIECFIQEIKNLNLKSASNFYLKNHCLINELLPEMNLWYNQFDDFCHYYESKITIHDFLDLIKNINKISYNILEIINDINQLFIKAISNIISLDERKEICLKLNAKIEQIDILINSIVLSDEKILLKDCKTNFELNYIIPFYDQSYHMTITIPPINNNILFENCIDFKCTKNTINSYDYIKYSKLYTKKYINQITDIHSKLFNIYKNINIGIEKLESNFIDEKNKWIEHLCCLVSNLC